MSDNTSLAKARGKARRMAMQALYQWQMTADDSDGIRRQFLEENDMRHVDEDYFTELFQGLSIMLKPLTSNWSNTCRVQSIL